MSDPNSGLTWETLTWQDIQAIGMALAERYPDEDTLTLAPDRLTRLVEDLADFESGDSAPDDFLLSAITTAWINAQEGDDDSSPFELQA